MPQEKTVAQEIIEAGTEQPKEFITVGSDEGDKPTQEGSPGKTKQQEIEDELFGKGDSTETTPEESSGEPEKELEQAKANAAFWQDAYQTFDGKLKKANPNLRDTLNKELHAQRKGKTEEPKPEAPKNLDPYENPQGFLDAIGDRLDRFEKNISNQYQQMQAQSNEQASWEQEAQAAEQAVNQLKSNYKAELKLDEKTWDDVEANAWEDVMDTLGLTKENKDAFLASTGNPTRTAKVFQKTLENRLLKHSYLTKIAQGQADVSGRIKSAQQVLQPTSQATPSPEVKSKTEKIISAIEGAAGNQEAKSELF